MHVSVHDGVSDEVSDDLDMRGLPREVLEGGEVELDEGGDDTSESEERERDELQALSPEGFAATPEASEEEEQAFAREQRCGLKWVATSSGVGSKGDGAGVGGAVPSLR
jgi:hypothetical protein